MIGHHHDKSIRQVSRRLQPSTECGEAGSRCLQSPLDLTSRAFIDLGSHAVNSVSAPPNNRRRFLQFLAASPLLAAQQAATVIADPKDAINVMDFEAAARQALPPAHFGYMATGVDDDLTLKANRDGFSKIHLRPRRLIDIRKVDLSVEMFGTKWETPIVIAPIGNQKAFHPEGELPVARAGRSRRHLQILSTATNTSVEEITEAAGRPVWYQLYPDVPLGDHGKVAAAGGSSGMPGSSAHHRYPSRPAHRNTRSLQASG